MNHLSVPMDEMPLDHFAFQQIGMSNTEVSTGSKCERAWLFGFHPETKLKPKTQGVALSRGITGHEVLEKFYKDIQREVEYDDAAQSALDFIEEKRQSAFMESDTDKMEMLRFLKKLMEAYFGHYQSDIENWEILEVEGFHALTWDGEDSLYLPMRLDMVIYQKSGAFKGETSPVDHKFTNDFWNQWKLRLNSQLPLYIRALRSSRFKGKPAPVVRRSIVNQIRTRDVRNVYPLEAFRRSFIEADESVMDKVFRNHLAQAKKIEPFKRMSYAEAHEQTTAAWGSSNCDFCFFKSICATDLEGGNMQQIAQLEYERSTYGYPTMEELYNEREIRG